MSQHLGGAQNAGTFENSFPKEIEVSMKMKDRSQETKALACVPCQIVPCRKGRKRVVVDGQCRLAIPTVYGMASQEVLLDLLIFAHLPVECTE